MSLHQGLGLMHAWKALVTLAMWELRDWALYCLQLGACLREKGTLPRAPTRPPPPPSTSPTAHLTPPSPHITGVPRVVSSPTQARAS